MVAKVINVKRMEGKKVVMISLMTFLFRTINIFNPCSGLLEFV